MRFPGSTSLSGRLLLWILPTFIVAAAVVSSSAYAIARRALMRVMEREVEVMTDVAAAEFRAFHDQRLHDLATIAQSPLFLDYDQNVEFGLAAEAEMFRKDIDRMLGDFAERAGVYTQLRFVDRAGRDVSRVERGGARARSAAAEPALLAGLAPGRQVKAELLPGRAGAPVLEARQGLYDEKGRLRGALVFRWSLARVLGQLARLKIGETGRSYLLRDGVPIARGAGSAPGPVLSARRELAGTRWSVWTVVRRAEFLDRLRWLGRLSVLLAACTMAVLALVVTRLVRALLRPLGALAEAAGAYAAGDLGVRVDAEGPGEVAALGRAFNDMAESLRQRTEDLEQRVRELTALQAMNEGVLRRLGRREIARLCLESAAKGLGFSRGALYWIDERAEEAVGECVVGAGAPLDEAAVYRRRVAFEACRELAESLRTRAAVHVGRTAEPALLPGNSAAGYGVVPILGRERVLAVMAVEGCAGAGPQPAQRLREASLFGGAVGLAIENSSLLEELVRSESRYRTAVENAPDSVIGLDQNLRVTLWNRRAEALFGYQPTEAYGRTLEFLFAPGAYAGLARRLETEGSLRQAEAAGRTRDGRALDLSVSWAGQSGGAGAAREWFVVIQDETAKKRVHAQLLQAEKMSAVGTLLASVVHELNNPLQGVIAFAEFLGDLPATAEQREDLRMLRHSAFRCVDIVQGLLSFARKGTTERHRVPLNRVVEAALALYEYRLAKSERVALEVELDPAKPEVAGEFRKLEQVLVNLLNNALDSLRKAPGRRLLRVRTRRASDVCEFEVEDTGPGVPPGVAVRLFEPFFTTKAGGGGTGLGLSISRELVESFGGTLSHSRPAEGGARFTASFPPCPAALARTDDPLGLPEPVSGRRVLVVDDEPDVLRVMRRILVEDGLVVEAVVDGAEALRRIRGERFHLVVADVELGAVRGTELAAAAAALPVPPAVILVTGDVLNVELKDELARYGAVVLSKPFLRGELVRLVRRTLHEASKHRGEPPRAL